MTDTERTRYSDAELEEFKVLIQDKIKKAIEQLELIQSSYKNDSNNGTDDTSPTFKAFDEGSEVMSKEANSQLAIRQEKFIRDLKNALVRIENKTYGVCRVTGKLINKEVNTEYLMHILQGKDKSIVVSKADFKTGEMKHFLLQENTILKTSEYGIPEPISGIEISPETLEVVFVPLLAFDLKGHRIGYGKGFYDRFLKKCNPTAVFIGLSFFDAEPEILFERTDIPLNFCITPKKIMDFQNNLLSL